MKTLSIFILLICNVAAFGLNNSLLEYRPEVEPCDNEGTNVTFVVSVLSSDCPALQNCTIHVVVYYKRTGAEIGSANYVYGTNTYYILVGYVDDSEEVCATLEINGYCNPSLTPIPKCISGSYSGNVPIDYASYTCD